VRYAQVDQLLDVVPTLDVLYQTRIQAERFESREEYDRHRGVYIVDPALMRRLPDHAILMHPLPRVGEIDPAVDADPRAAYFRQARNGLVVRMAALHWVMAG
jgi:aspartate carbamoyltransferase catalytic subunit